MTLREKAGRVVRRHPKLWGLAFAVLLAGAYVVGLRPLRVAMGDHVALPLFQSIHTPRSEQFELQQTPLVRGSVYAVPRGEMTDQARLAGTAQWAPPAGALFILPALFLVLAFPDKPYWLYLFAYHVAVGAAALLVFAVGLGWAEPAFSLYTFSRTYMTEGVSLAVPLLLWLAGRASGQDADVSAASASAS